ncbi:hypothetical protein Q9L58_009894 [Maublancomyces gigas]|uniref:Uncharacterized protein n=1 Tax=Discina gigas TaxID=1032678 RepID=A0ABR3G628_9PEZI
MNLFDLSISASLAVTLIDIPSNAMRVATEFHDAIGRLQCYFEPAPLRVDLPSPLFLKFHLARCMMLEMSGAGEYVESLLHDTETLMQRGVLAEDGSSNFALDMRLRGLAEDEAVEDEVHRRWRESRVEVESC